LQTFATHASHVDFSVEPTAQMGCLHAVALAPSVAEGSGGVSVELQADTPTTAVAAMSEKSF
jgi:hypothetical protein